MTASVLLQLAKVACAKRPFVQIEQEGDQQQQPTSNVVEEPPRKKVRFVGVKEGDSTADASTTEQQPPRAPSAPRKLEKLMEKVRRRAQRRNQRRSLRSPPPPISSSVEDTPAMVTTPSLATSCDSLDLATMQRKLLRMEQIIKDNARTELELMNKAKRMQDRRALLTRKYEGMAQQFHNLTQDSSIVFQMGRLPPLMHQARRVSADNEHIINLSL